MDIATHAVQETSGRALSALGNQGLKKQQDRVMYAARMCADPREGASLREIKRAYIQAFGTDIDVSTISGRVNALVSAKRLVRSEYERKCAVTGATVKPVFVPAEQGTFAGL